MRHAAWPIAIAAAVLFLVVAAPNLLGGHRDPFDRLEVMTTEADEASGRHAVTYRYHHAGGSSDVYATWIQTGSPPVSSTQPPSARGGSVLV